MDQGRAKKNARKRRKNISTILSFYINYLKITTPKIINFEQYTFNYLIFQIKR